MHVGPGVGLDRIFNGSTGTQVNRMLDALGLPDAVGDLIGAKIDAQRGDFKGMMRNLQDLNSGLSTGQMDNIFGKGLVPGGFVPRPMSFLTNVIARPLLGVGNLVGGLANAALAMSPLGLAGGLAGAILGRGFSPFGSVTREAPFGRGMVGRSIERQINANPFFKAQMEQALGGRIIADGRNDGKLTVFRSPFANVGGMLRNAFAGGLLPRVGIAAALGGLAIPFAGAMAANAVARGVLGFMGRMEANISSFMGGGVNRGGAQFGTGAAGGASGIPGTGGENTTVTAGEVRADMVKDPEAQKFAQGMGIDIQNASFEDLLFLMLMKYASKKEKEIMGKVKALDKSIKAADDAKAKGSTESADNNGQAQRSGGGGGGGFLGGIVSGIGNAIGGIVSQVPIFGGIAGGLVRGVSGLAGGLLGGISDTQRQQMGGAGGAQANGGQGVDATNSETIDGQKVGEMSETLKQQMLQKLMSDLNKMYEMLSNMMKSMHDMQMTPIRALRG